MEPLSPARFSDEHFGLLTKLSQLSPEECLNALAEYLKQIFSCEAVCILLWSEPDKKLVTVARNGIPDRLLKAEQYGPTEGVTGKIIFSEQRWLRALIDLDNRRITDLQSGKEMIEDTVNWRNMDAFKNASAFRDFRSLLGAPFFIKDQEPGVVKLINKTNPTNRRELAEEGFDHEDVQRLEALLNTVEYIIETKRNEKHLSAIVRIIQDVVGVDLNHADLLKNIATVCASELNYNVCLIRVLEGNKLRTYSSDQNLIENTLFEPNHPTLTAIERNVPLTWTLNSKSDEWPIKLSSPVGSDSLLLNDPSSHLVNFLKARRIASFLILPIGESGRQIGTLECYTSLPHVFSSRELDGLKLYAAVIQRASVSEEQRIINTVLTELNSTENPIDPLSSTEDIYSTLVGIIEKVMRTNAVSLWEKKATREGFKLSFLHSSRLLSDLYAEKGRRELPQDSFTGEAATTGEIKYVSYEDVKSDKFALREKVLAKGLKAMTCIPIKVGKEVYGVIDAFSQYDVVPTSEKKEALEILAGNAALAIQSAKLIHSFSAISTALAKQDLNKTLQNIADNALDVLHANPVILFRYENKCFHDEMVSNGEFFRPELMDLPIRIKDDDLVNLILREGTRYFENVRDYFRFQKESNLNWRIEQFEQGFWKRERIKASAALRLEYGDEYLGVMFVNYRTKQVFNEATRKLINAFALQAATAIATAKLLEQERTFWELQRRDSLSLSVSEIVTSLAHNSGNLVYSLSVYFAALDDLTKNAEGKTIEKEKVKVLTDNMREPLTELVADFGRLQEYRKFAEFKEESTKLEDLIDKTLQMLQSRIDRNRVTVKKFFATPPTPPVWCDRNQIQHVLLNLIINSLDAMGRKGTLSIGTETYRDGRFVRIRITDTGTGIPPELHAKIFQPYFTTKDPSGGTGLGLPVSKYIVEQHGGSIEFVSRSGKETTFHVVLPVQRKGE